MGSMMRQEVREYLRASARLFGLAYQENALTDMEREAIVSYAQEVEKKFNRYDQQEDQPFASSISNLSLQKTDHST